MDTLVRTVWVAYKPGEGFLRRHSKPTDDFTNARIYNKRGHLTNSVGKWAIDKKEIIPIAIEMSISEEYMVYLKLGGTNGQGS